MSGLPPYRLTRVTRTAFRPGQRILMISDIHGHDTVFRKLLSKAGFTADDALVIVGDLLEKGEESLKVIRTLMSLEQTHNVFVLLGNMDAYTIYRTLSDDPDWYNQLFDTVPKMIRWWGGCLLDEMCREICIRLTPDSDRVAVLREVRRHFAPEFRYLTGLKTILDTPTMTFVHGGVPHLRLDELEGTPNKAFLKNDNFLAQGLSFPRYLVVGHWPTVLYRQGVMDMSPLILRDRRIISLDGGCGVKRSGQLNCVIRPDAESEDFECLWADGLPHIRALSSQEAGPEPVTVHFHDRVVEILDRGTDFSTVRYHGRETRVPTETIDPDQPGMLTTDMTDFRPAVRPGDEMSLIMTCGGEAYVRINSVLGWYQGEYEYVSDHQE